MGLQCASLRTSSRFEATPVADVAGLVQVARQRGYGPLCLWTSCLGMLNRVLHAASGLIYCALLLPGCTSDLDLQDVRLDASTSPDTQEHAKEDARSVNAREAGAVLTDAAMRREAGTARSDANVRDATNGLGCTGHDYLFCEDFEGPINGQLPEGWSIDNGWQEGEPTVSDAEARSGARSLRSAPARYGQKRIRHAIDHLGTARGKHWGRVFYKVRSPHFVGGYVHNTMVGLLASTECRVVDTVLGPDDTHQFLFNIPDDSCCAGSRYDYKSYDGAWHCAEWSIDASTKSFRFYFDGKEVTDIALNNRNGSQMGDFSDIVLGWRNYQTHVDAPYDAFLDDLAIDDERIGCE